jgi:hypothetical protein
MVEIDDIVRPEMARRCGTLHPLEMRIRSSRWHMLGPPVLAGATAVCDFTFKERQRKRAVIRPPGTCAPPALRTRWSLRWGRR